jgi:hypothetical protein
MQANIFSFFVTSDGGEDPYVDIGGYLESRMEGDEDDIVWLTAQEDYFWKNTVTAFKFGDQGYYIDTIDALFDTGTSFMYVPTNIGDDFFNVLLAGVDY